MNFRNESLKKIRTSLHLSRYEASKICKMSIFRYADYEDGYILISDKRAKKFADSFDVDVSLFDDEFYLIKPEEIIDEENISDKFNHFFFSVPILIISIITLIASLTVSLTSSISLAYTKSNPTSFYSENFIQVTDEIITSEKSQTTVLPDLYNLMSITNRKISTEVDIGDEINTVDFITSKDVKFSNIFASRITFKNINDKDDNENDLIDDDEDFSNIINDSISNYTDVDIGLIISAILSSFSTDNSLTIITSPLNEKNIDFIFNTTYKDLRYRIDGFYNCNEFEVNHITTFSLDFTSYEILNKEDIQVKEVIDDINIIAKEKLKLTADVFSSTFNINQNYYSFLDDINFSLVNHYKNYFNNILLLEIFGSIFIVSILICFCFLINYIFYSNAKKNNTINNEVKVFETYPLKMPYKKNFRFNFLIKERYYKFFGILLLFFSNFYLYYLISSYLNYDPLTINNSVEIIASTMKDLAPVASLIILTITIDRVKNGKHLFLKTFFFLILGLFLAFYELILMVEISNFSQIIPFLFSFLPTNTFFAIGIFSFIGVFLFTKPNFIHSKQGLVIYRLCCIIPMSILFLNYFQLLSPEIEISVYAKPFIIQRSFYELIYGIIYLFFLYFSRVYLLKKYGEKRIDIVLNSNKYVLIRNLFLCTLIMIIGLLNHYVTDASLIKVLKIKTSPYYFYLIPLFLFSKPQIEKENTKESIVYISSLVSSYVIPYLMIFIQLNRIANII